MLVLSRLRRSCAAGCRTAGQSRPEKGALSARACAAAWPVATAPCPGEERWGLLSCFIQGRIGKDVSYVRRAYAGGGGEKSWLGGRPSCYRSELPRAKCVRLICFPSRGSKGGIHAVPPLEPDGAWLRIRHVEARRRRLRAGHHPVVGARRCAVSKIGV